MNLFADLPEGVCRQDVAMAPLTWFQLGGSADYVIEPQTQEQLARVVRRCLEIGLPIHVLGFGANVLVPDEGVRGVVLRLTAGSFNDLGFSEDRVRVGGGFDMAKLTNACVRRGLAGVEALAGIPGTVGGGVAMNCGGRYGEIGSAVRTVQVMGPDGTIYERSASELRFSYRHANVGDEIVLGAVLHLTPMDPDALEARFREIWEYKKSTQPALGAPSAGCIFRNPKGHSAGQLIDRAGLKGFRIGSAHVSDLHANFALADRGGRATDVRNLIDAVIEKVDRHCGIRLEPEVKIW